MDFSQHRPIMISPEKSGPEKRARQSFPKRLYQYGEIRTQGFEFCFNMNGEITTVRGLNPDWPHPAEHFKRTAGNDWVYYTVGDKSGSDGIISWMGEYYLPCLPYASNPVWDIPYTSNPVVMNGLAQWSQLYADLYMAKAAGLYPHAADLMDRILAHDDQALHERARKLNRIIGTDISVLPPDTRHVDYDVIPLTIADGCLYRCKFCCVKSGEKFQKRSRENILNQINALKAHFGADITNYHGLFLGNHDGLAAGLDPICFAAREAYRALGFGPRMDEMPYLFLFGSVGSFLGADTALFDQLNALPFYTYINIGFESLDARTLDRIGKPVSPRDVGLAFEKMMSVNAGYRRIEVTGNFILGEDLPRGHLLSLSDLLKGAAPRSKGTVYLSPLKESPKKRELLDRFYPIKQESRLPVFAYLIQRL